MITNFKNAPTAPYQKNQTNKKNMLEMAKSYELDWREHIKIKKFCDKTKYNIWPLVLIKNLLIFI